MDKKYKAHLNKIQKKSIIGPKITNKIKYNLLELDNNSKLSEGKNKTKTYKINYYNNNKTDNNIKNFFNKKGIYHIYISKGLIHFKDKIEKIYNLKCINYEMKTINKSIRCLFFGYYEMEDLKYIKQFENVYLMWGGSDIDLSFNKKIKYKLIKSIINLQVNHISISKSIYNRLLNIGITSELFNLNLVNPLMYSKLNEINLLDNNFIYVYNGFRTGLTHIYGDYIYNKVIYNLSDFSYIFSNVLNYPSEKIFELYKKCFLSLRLTDNDGNANTVQELKECNINVICNSEESNCIKWNNSTDIILSIANESIKHFTNYIKKYFKSILILCTDYPNYGGAATNTLDLLLFLKNLSIKSFIFYITDLIDEQVYNDYIITKKINYLSKFNEYNKVYNFDLIITRNYISKQIINHIKLPIFFLIPGIFGPNLDKYYYNLITKKEIDNYINNRIIRTCKKASKIFVASKHTSEILSKYYGIKSSILYFNYVNFNKSIIINTTNLNKKIYSFGIIISDFDRKIKNVDNILKKLIETNKKIILIGKNSNKYENKNIDCVDLIDKDKLKYYYSIIDYVVNDSYYESCSNVGLEAKYYGSIPLLNENLLIKQISDNTDNLYQISCKLESKVILIESFKFEIHDYILINKYVNLGYVPYFIIKEEDNHRLYRNHNIIYCNNDSWYKIIKYIIYFKNDKFDILYYNFKVHRIVKLKKINLNNLYKLLYDEDYIEIESSKAYINEYNANNLNNLCVDENRFTNLFLKLVYCCDKKYFIGMITSINSIIKNTRHVDKLIFYLCIPSKDVTYLIDLINMYSIKFNYIIIKFEDVSLDKIVLNKDGGHLKSIGNYIRILFPDLFNYTKMIYLDSDLVVNSDIYLLDYLQIYDEKIISGIESQTTYDIIVNKSYRDQIKIDDYNKKIINTGIYVINCVLWKKNNIYNEILKTLNMHNRICEKDKNGLFRCFTMSLLNIALYKKIEYFMYHRVVIDLGWKDIDNNTLNNADILDWSGNNKPWLINSKYSEYWFKYYPNYMQKNIIVIISHPLDTIGGSQSFIKHIINKNNNYNYIIFHNGMKVFRNIPEYEISNGNLYAIIKNLTNVNCILFNNSIWDIEQLTLDWLMKLNIKKRVIIHNEYSPVIKYILKYDTMFDKLICINDKIYNKLKFDNKIKIYPLTFNITNTRLINKTKSNKIYFGYIGRICKYKFIDPIINIFSKIDNLVLRIICDKYDNRYNNIKNIEVFIGLTNLDEIYEKIDYLILTSITEGFPCCILESLNYGIPIISTDVGGISELITNGYNGYLINVNYITDTFSDIYMENFNELYDEFNKNIKLIENELYDIIIQVPNRNSNKYNIMRLNCIYTLNKLKDNDNLITNIFR